MPAFAVSRRLVSVLLLFLVVDVLASRTVGQETSQELLIGRLKQTQVAPKVSAARRLAEQGTLAAKAAPALIECLSDPSADVRVVAAFALAKVSTDRSASIAAMQSILSDASEHVRYSAQWSTAQLASQLPLDLVEPELSETILMLDKSLELLRSHEHQPRHRAALESVIELLRSRVALSAPPKLVAPERSATEPVLAKPVPEDKTNSASPSVDAADLVQGLYEPNDAISRMQTIRRLRDPQRFPTEIRQNVLKFEATQLDYVLLDYAIALWGKSIQSDMSSLLDDIAIDGVLPDYAYQFIERLQATDQETVVKLQGWSHDSRQPQEVRAAAIKAISLSQHDRQGCIRWIASLLADTDLQMDAAYSLSELGGEASSAEPQLIAAIRASTDESFQIAGIIALDKIADDSTTAAQFVNQWLAATPPDSPFLPFLLDSSGQFSKVADSVIPLLRQNLLNANIDARLAAVKALQQFGERAEAALPELMRLLTSPSEEAFIQSAAARAVGAIGPATSEQLLRAILP